MLAPEPFSSVTPCKSSVPHDNGSFWSDFSRMSGAILVVGHGTRNPTGSAQLLELVDHMRAQAPSANILGCFLELAEPLIEQAMERLHELQTKKILVVPVLLFTAGHALLDIPDVVSRSAIRFGIEVVGQTGSLGTHPAVLTLSQVRYEEVTSLAQGNCCPPKACAKVECIFGKCEGRNLEMGRIGWAMVGRGTSEPQALAHMRQFTELRKAHLFAVRYQTGFFAGGRPDVDELLEEAARWECDTVLVQPHLLFEGELIEQLRTKVKIFQSRFPNKHWLIARTLGADFKLADVFLELARKQIEMARTNHG